MKKSTLALSVTAALAGLGFVSNALAIGVLANNNSLVTSGAIYTASGTAMAVNTDGIGNQLVFPYFSSQAGNATLLNITNTDATNGKVVKVRFRGAANSDDLFDFQVLLSPGDTWVGTVTQDPTTKVAMLASNGDTTCVLPAVAKSATGALFLTGRVDPTPAKGSSANETNEGYVEVLNMADIPPTIKAITAVAANPAAVPPVNAVAAVAASTNALFTTIKHKAFVAPATNNTAPTCDPTVLETKLGSDYATVGAAYAAGLEAPTGMLTGDWIILNQANTAAWSGSATALQVTGGAGNLAFWPQKNGTPLMAASDGNLNNQLVTADPLFTRKVVAIQNYDLPDLSTPVIGGVAGDVDATHRANRTSALLAVKTITNQYVTKSGINAVTDFLFTQPTRRYYVGVNYKATAATAVTGTIGLATVIAAPATTGALAAPIYNSSFTTAPTAYYTDLGTTKMLNRQVCLTSIPGPATNELWDREETTAGSAFVISPGTALTNDICGEAAVTSVNAGTTASALNASVVRNDITFAAGFDAGWVKFNTANTNDTGLPILGSSFIRAANGAVNYGFAWAHKVTR